MKIIEYDLPEPTSLVTSLTESVDYNDTVLIVEDSTGLNVDDFLLIGEQGSEFNEIVRIIDIDNEELTVTNLKFPHEENIIVHKLEYDKFKLTKSEDSYKHKDVVTKELDYSNTKSIIEYVDDKGHDNLYYNIYYVNSATDTEDLQDTIKENTISNLSIDEFREDSKYNKIEVNDEEISRGLRAGLEWVQDNAYKSTVLNTTQQDTMFDLDLGNMVLCDWNGDNKIDKKDLTVYETDNSGNRYYINHKILRVYPNSNRILFKEKVPKQGRELVFLLKTTFKPLEEVKTTLKTIIKLIATNWIMRNTDTSKIKTGVSDWSAAGTNVNRDLNSLKESIKNNYDEAQRLLHQILKIYMRSTKLRTSYSHLNWNNRYNSHLGGNVLFKR